MAAVEFCHRHSCSTHFDHRDKKRPPFHPLHCSQPSLLRSFPFHALQITMPNLSDATHLTRFIASTAAARKREERTKNSRVVEMLPMTDDVAVVVASCVDRASEEGARRRRREHTCVLSFLRLRKMRSPASVYRVAWTKKSSTSTDK